jgi:hypothetical protein
MTDKTDFEIAERISRRRARMFPLLGIYFLAGQAMFFRQTAAEPERIASFKISAWLVWAIVLLFLLGIGGGALRSRKVRALMEDETTAANRLRAYSVGFWSASGTAVGLYVVSMFEAVSGREAIHIILTAAVAGALLMFGMLERRALKYG